MFDFLVQNWVEIVTAIISLIVGGGSGIYFVRKNIQKNGNNGNQIIGGQTVIHNYLGDPLLGRQISVENPIKIESQDSAREKARSALGLNGKNVKFLSEKLQQIYQNVGLSKTSSTMIDGAIFALASSYTKENPEWREHCAGSLRGLVDKWRDAGAISTAFCKTFNNKSASVCPNLETHANQYKQLINSFNYFSEIHHHDSVNILAKIKVLKGNNMKTGSDTDELFIEIAKEYLEVLINLLTEATKHEST